MSKLVLALFCALACCNAAYGIRAVDSFLGPNDINRLQKVFTDGLASSDLQSIYYSTVNTDVTDSTIKQTCSRLNQLHEESKINDFEKDFYYVGAHKQLRCTEKLSDTVLSKINDAFKSDPTSAQEIYYRVATLKALGKQVSEAAVKKIVKVLQDLLKKDDSLANLGYSFNVVADLNNNAEAAFVADRVEDAIAQADEVDGRMLQFEGGLSITALVVNGAFKITKAFNKPTPISAVQAVKLATYFLSRRSVQTAKGAHVLLEGLKTLSNAGKLAPICIQHIGNGQLEPEATVLNLAVVDLLGKPLSPVPQNVLGKVTSKVDNTVLAEKLQFTSKSSDKTVFVADLSTYKPTRGIYSVDVSVDNVYSLSLQFKILGRVKVASLEIGVAEPDASSLVKKQSLSFPNKLSEVLEADSTQKVVLKAVLVDEKTTKAINVHQAFVRFYNKDADKEIIFVAEQDSSKAYKFDIDVGARGADFDYQSGIYQIYLIVGDAAISNSFQWHVASVDLKYSLETRETKKHPIRSALPEIEHLFRAPEKRPPRLVSDIFTGLCLTPLVLLFLFWGKLGINTSSFSLSPSTIGFHVGFGGILALFAIFWLNLNMFQTLRFLIPLAVLTFLCGNRLLRRLYAQRVLKSGGASSSSS